MVADFNADLAFSQSHDELWLQAYRLAFPGLLAWERIDDMERQRVGIDRLLFLPYATFKIEEKQRRNGRFVYLELFHIGDDGSKWPGWLNKPLECDWIAFLFIETRAVWLWRWQALQDWYRQVQPINDHWETQRNATYNSYCEAVPPEVIHDGLPENARIYVQIG